MNSKQKREAAKENKTAASTTAIAGENTTENSSSNEMNETKEEVIEHMIHDPAKAKMAMETGKVNINDITVDIKLGRPVDATSERQKRLAAIEAKRTEMGGDVKRGRPKDPTSRNAQKTAVRDLRIAMTKLDAAEKLVSDGVSVEGIETLRTEVENLQSFVKAIEPATT